MDPLHHNKHTMVNSHNKATTNLPHPRIPYINKPHSGKATTMDAYLAFLDV